MRELYKILLMCLCMTGCKKYLDKKQDAKLIIPSSLSDAQALLDYTVEMNQQSTPTYGEASSDSYFIKDIDFNTMIINLQSVYTWKYYPFQVGAEDWSPCYLPVYNANLALDLLKDIPQSGNNQEAWKNVKGSALFFRSYYFLCLLWNYAKAYDSITAGKDLGIVLRMTSDFNVPSIRSTSQACYEQVINDTKASIPLLPDYPLHVMRPSKGAAYGLLARCYLSMRDYKDALIYADSSLQLNHQLMDYNDDPDIPSGFIANYPFKQFNKETIFYTELDGIYSLYYGSKGRTDTTLYNIYSNDDCRKQAYYLLNADGYHQFKGSYSGTKICFSGIATDEMYLTRAECYIRLGEVPKGLDDLNSLMYKRYKTGTFISYSNLTQNESLKRVLLERRKELEFRGMRWMDIKRLNKEGEEIILKRVINGIAYTLQPNANFYALPLPDDIIKQTGIEQNPL